MPATPDPPVWQIVPDAGGHFRWSVVGANAESRYEDSCVALAFRPEGQPSTQLPSMADLLLKVSAEVQEGGGGGCDSGAPMFRTASGKSVSVRESSIRKAESVLGGAGVPDRGTPMFQNSDVCDGGIPKFRTGLGKPVTVRQSSIRKAAAVLEGHAVREGAPMVQNSDVCEAGFPMFSTGLGNLVSVRQSSIRKAAAVLEGENFNMAEILKPSECGYNRNSASVFQNGSGKSILLKQSSLKKAMSVLKNVGNFETDLGLENRIDDGRSFSNSLFQTGSGKTVHISSAGLLRAATLLGVEENHASSDRFVSELIGFNSEDPKSENVDCEVLVNVNLGAKANTNANHEGPEVCKKSDCAQPTIKFHTAGGRYISVSTDALQRAKSLLGGANFGVFQDDMEGNKPFNTFLKDDKAFDDISWNKENLTSASIFPNAEICKTNKSISSGAQPFSTHKPGGVAFDQVNACGMLTDMLETKSIDGPPLQKLESISIRRSSILDNAVGTITASRMNGEPLVDISNTTGTEHTSRNCWTSERKRLRRRSSISPFKRPRNSSFTTPLKCNSSALASGPSVRSPSKDRSCRKGVSTHYPAQVKRKTIKEFFGMPPFHTNLIGHLPDEVKHISADTAEKYHFHDTFSLGEVGPREFHAMLLQSGTSSSHVTKEWISNHYKWIVWKLASLERCYPAQASSKYLTVSNVLEELKYRYEREVNYGHRSAIKKILDGDASAASAVVLCISSIQFYSNLHNCKMDEIAEPHNMQKLGSSDAPECYHAAKIELSDGWYALDAQLDTSLLKQLVNRKLFVGQKLRIVGAYLCGWVAPVSPLEAHGTVSLLLSINGTYRAHWAEHLGFCKGTGAPLAFSCIKSAGGKVPRTLVGITRIYPVLYKERLPDGGSIVRSERMEKEVLRLYDQRRSSIVEDVVSKHQDFMVNGDDSEEGAKLFKILQTAAEPEVLMADMTSEQLSSFTEYQAKHEANRQSEMHKKIEKALEDAGLGAREVTTFVRVRVVGLTSKGSCKKARPTEGLITVWNPTEKQKQDLVEGQIYCVRGLMPLHSGSDVIYLQGRGSSTLWELLAPKEHEKFEPFFTPRKPVSLSNLGDMPLASEFDIAAVVVHVGEVCLSDRHKKQWVFMTDESCGSSDSEFEGPYSCLLAVNFCGPIFNNDSSSLISHNLSGMVVGFFNLVKRERDQMNHLWVAEASENSSYSVYSSLSTTSHLYKTGECAQKWAKISSSVRPELHNFKMTIQKLRERVLCIIQGH